MIWKYFCYYINEKPTSDMSKSYKMVYSQYLSMCLDMGILKWGTILEYLNIKEFEIENEYIEQADHIINKFEYFKERIEDCGQKRKAWVDEWIENINEIKKHVQEIEQYPPVKDSKYVYASVLIKINLLELEIERVELANRIDHVEINSVKQSLFDEAGC